MTDGANAAHSVILQNGELSYGSNTNFPYVQVGGEHFKKKMICSQQQHNCHSSNINLQVVKLAQEPQCFKSQPFQAFVRTLFQAKKKQKKTPPENI